MAIDHEPPECLTEAFPEIYALGMREGERRHLAYSLEQTQVALRAFGLSSFQARPIQPERVCMFVMKLLLGEPLDDAARAVRLTDGSGDDDGDSVRT